MLDEDDGKPMKFNIKVKVNDKVRLSESMKKNVKEIILEPHAKIIIERESIELSNDTFNKIHIYIQLRIMNIILRERYRIHHDYIMNGSF